MSLEAQLVAALSAWRGGHIWFTERLSTGGQTSFAQQSFRLLRADPGDVLRVTGRWGHDLSLLPRAITHIKLEPRAIEVTERLSARVSRASTFRLLALQDPARTSISDAGHVWFSDTNDLQALGATETAFCLDNYLRGRSSLDAREHARLRRAVERTTHDPKPDSRSDLVKALRRWRKRPVVFWVGATLREQVAFWCACHVLTSTGLTLNAWFAGPSRAELDPDPRFGLQVTPLERIAGFLGEATPLSARAIDHFASRWDSFCRGRRPVDAQVAGWPRSRGWALELPEIFDAPFPRRRRQTLRLSRLDEELLTPFGTDWSTPLALLGADSDRWPLAMTFLGDSLPSRLRAWAEIEAGRFLSSRAASRPRPNEWTRMEYRLTDEGRALLTRGVSSAEQVPEFALGGFPLAPSP
jgi:hypothetical protein